MEAMELLPEYEVKVSRVIDQLVDQFKKENPEFSKGDQACIDFYKDNYSLMSTLATIDLDIIHKALMGGYVNKEKLLNAIRLSSAKEIFRFRYELGV